VQIAARRIPAAAFATRNRRQRISVSEARLRLEGRAERQRVT